MSVYLHPPVIISILILLTAVSGDLILGDPPTSAHPVGLQGRYISGLWKKRPVSGSRRLFFFGIFIAVSGILISWAAAAGVQSGLLCILRIGPSPLFGIIAVILSAVLLKGSFSFRNLLQAGTRVAAALAERV